MRGLFGLDGAGDLKIGGAILACMGPHERLRGRLSAVADVAFLVMGLLNGLTAH